MAQILKTEKQQVLGRIHFVEPVIELTKKCGRNGNL